MSAIRLHVIEVAGKDALIREFEAFAKDHAVLLQCVKFQRNLFYAGIGASAGRTPGSAKRLDATTKLDESWVAFIPWENDTDRIEDTRFRD
jgi:hypothetical protein